MDVQEYIAAHPEYPYPTALTDPPHGKLAEGMLQFTEDTAHCWAGPFPDNFAHYVLKDCHSWPLRTMAEERMEHARWMLPDRVRPQTPIQNEQQLAKLLERLTPKERKAWDTHDRRAVENPTIEFPFRLHISGNDDCSYSKFFATREEGEQEIALLLACQPLDFWKDIEQNGYVFTN